MSDKLVHPEAGWTKKPVIRYLHIDVTVICNLHCTYCYYGDYNNAASAKKEVTEDRLIELITEAKSLGCERVIFSGGEIFASKKTPALLMHCFSLGLEMTLITNGTLLTPDRHALLASLKENIHEIKVSFDGGNHDTIRGAGTSKKTLDAIAEFDRAGLPWTLNTILTRFSLDGLDELYDWLTGLHPKAWRLDLPFMQGNYTRTHDSLAITNFEDLFRRLAALLSRYLRERPRYELWMFTIYRPGLEDWDFTKQDLGLHPCTYNKRNLSIRGNGEVTPCSRLLTALGNVKDDDLSSLRQGGAFTDFWKIRIHDLNGCHNCRYVYACGGGCRAHALYETGSMINADPIGCLIMPYFEKFIVPQFMNETQACFAALLAEAERDICSRGLRPHSATPTKSHGSAVFQPVLALKESKFC